MKIKVLVAALMVVVVGFAACGGKKDKDSSEKAITKFTVGGVDYHINESTKTITYLYPKTVANTWTGEPTWPAEPSIIISAKANISPSPKERKNFVDGSVVYTVTAEDGSTQTYTVKAERGELP